MLAHPYFPFPVRGTWLSAEFNAKFIQLDDLNIY